jgi:hypothetical protein
MDDFYVCEAGAGDSGPKACGGELGNLHPLVAADRDKKLRSCEGGLLADQEAGAFIVTGTTDSSFLA